MLKTINSAAPLTPDSARGHTDNDIIIIIIIEICI